MEVSLLGNWWGSGGEGLGFGMGERGLGKKAGKMVGCGAVGGSGEKAGVGGMRVFDGVWAWRGWDGYANGIRILDKIRVDVDELHVMLFHNLAADFDVEKVETFWCRVNIMCSYYRLENDVDVLRLISSLKHGDLVDVYVVHQISEPIVVNDNVAATPPLLLLSNGDVAALFETDRADVSSSHPLNINGDEYINENQPPRKDKRKAKVSCEDLGEGQVNDFSTYYLQKFDSELDFDITDSDGDSLYDVDENIKELSDFDEELLQAKKSNIEKQAKKKTDRVNLDEIPSGPVGINAGFEDICKNKVVRYKGKLGGDDPYFDSSNTDSDISDKEERDPVDDDEVVDPLPRTSSSKIYFDKTTKKFARLYDYDEQLRTTNPGTTISIRTSKNAIPGKEVVVGKEIKGTWSWFLRCISHDLELEENRGEGLKVMSDMQEVYDKYIQTMKNIKMWPRSTRPPIEPPEITLMPGRPGKNRKKAKDELVKKEVWKGYKKGKKWHVPYPSLLDTTRKDVQLWPAGRPANAHSAPRGAERPTNGHSAARTVGRPANAVSVGGVRPASTSIADVRPTATAMPTITSAVGDNATQSTTQQSTSGVGAQQRKTSTVLIGGTNLAYKRPRLETNNIHEVSLSQLKVQESNFVSITLRPDKFGFKYGLFHRYTYAMLKVQEFNFVYVTLRPDNFGLKYGLFHRCTNLVDMVHFRDYTSLSSKNKYLLIDANDDMILTKLLIDTQISSRYANLWPPFIKFSPYVKLDLEHEGPTCDLSWKGVNTVPWVKTSYTNLTELLRKDWNDTQGTYELNRECISGIWNLKWHPADSGDRTELKDDYANFMDQAKDSLRIYDPTRHIQNTHHYQLYIHFYGTGALAEEGAGTEKGAYLASWVNLMEYSFTLMLPYLRLMNSNTLDSFSSMGKNYSRKAVANSSHSMGSASVPLSTFHYLNHVWARSFCRYVANSTLSMEITPMISVTFWTWLRNSCGSSLGIEPENKGGFIRVKSQILAATILATGLVGTAVGRPF
ncbi:hypothetical protein FXO37_25211 [Capsicum annuum]|nr:hypothetical protein FXO37_25211 [Capsicum annuum]